MRYPRAMPTSKRKDFTQTALDVVRQATGEAPLVLKAKGPRKAAQKPSEPIKPAKVPLGR